GRIGVGPALVEAEAVEGAFGRLGSASREVSTRLGRQCALSLVAAGPENHADVLGARCPDAEMDAAAPQALRADREPAHRGAFRVAHVELRRYGRGGVRAHPLCSARWRALERDLAARPPGPAGAVVAADGALAAESSCAARSQSTSGEPIGAPRSSHR